MSSLAETLNELAPPTKAARQRDEPTINDTPYEVAMKLEKRLRSALQRAVGVHRVEDAWSEVVLERVTMIMRRYDPTKGTIANHVIACVKWYTYKWNVSSRAAKQRKATESIADRELAPHCDSDAGVLIRDVIGWLDPFDAWVVEQHHLEGYSIKELADASGRSAGHIKRRLEFAMREMREYMDDETIVARN